MMTSLILLLGMAAHGDSPQFQGPHWEHQDECINPMVESMSWYGMEGTVTNVISGEEIVVRSQDGRSTHVVLVGLDGEHDAPSAARALAKLVQDKRVSVSFNPRAGEGALLGRVHLEDENYLDVNREMLRSGLVRFKEPPFYSVSEYSKCLYKIAEREARQAKRGLWQ